ncbi:MAG TPA: hypothetical protein VFC92_11040 [Bacteroidales bacterium]|nr:hypothetical protein [Bacteroidales bacterium]
MFGRGFGGCGGFDTVAELVEASSATVSKPACRSPLPGYFYRLLAVFLIDYDSGY